MALRIIGHKQFRLEGTLGGQPVPAQPGLLQGLFLPQGSVLHFSLNFMKVLETPVSPFLHPTCVSLNGRPTLQHISLCLQLGVIRKLEKRVNSITSSETLIQILSRTGPRIDPLQLHLLTSRQGMTYLPVLSKPYHFSVFLPICRV